MKIDLADFRNIDFSDVGKWPLPVKVIAIVALSVAVVGAGFWFDTRNQLETLDIAVNKEEELKEIFKSKQNLMQSLKLAAFASTPSLVAGIFNIYPPIALITILFALYGLYLLYIGIPVFMETPKDQHIVYLIVCIIVLIVFTFIISWIATSIMWSTVGGWGSWVPSFGPY